MTGTVAAAAAATPAVTASPFDALLAEIGTVTTGTADLAKALGEAAAKTDGAPGGDDAAIAAAAGEGTEGEGDGKPAEGAAADGAEPELGKSFAVTYADGTQGEAIDATDLLKSLMDRVELGETKSVEVTTGLLAVIKSQGEMLKSLSEQITTFANQGRPRKAVVTVAEKPAAVIDAGAAAAADGISEAEFWGKAMAAQVKGAINSVDIAILEGDINRGLQPRAEIVQRILAAGV